MPRKHYKPEKIIKLLRLVEIEVGQGKTAGQACKKLGFTEQSYYRWRKEYGGLQINQAKRLKELEKENSRLKKLVADLSLDCTPSEPCGPISLIA
jgi:putative transposase